MCRSIDPKRQILNLYLHILQTHIKAVRGFNEPYDIMVIPSVPTGFDPLVLFGLHESLTKEIVQVLEFEYHKIGAGMLIRLHK